MPARSSIFNWLQDHSDFADRYARAKQIQVWDLLDEILDTSRDSSNDWSIRTGPDGKTYREVDHENIKQSKIKIGALKWLVTKLSAKKYRQERSGK
jgi:terminase small subunit-like protein